MINFIIGDDGMVLDAILVLPNREVRSKNPELFEKLLTATIDINANLPNGKTDLEEILVDWDRDIEITIVVKDKTLARTININTDCIRNIVTMEDAKPTDYNYLLTYIGDHVYGEEIELLESFTSLFPFVGNEEKDETNFTDKTLKILNSAFREALGTIKGDRTYAFLNDDVILLTLFYNFFEVNQTKITEDWPKELWKEFGFRASFYYLSKIKYPASKEYKDI